MTLCAKHHSLRDAFRCSGEALQEVRSVLLLVYRPTALSRTHHLVQLLQQEIFAQGELRAVLRDLEKV